MKNLMNNLEDILRNTGKIIVRGVLATALYMSPLITGCENSSSSSDDTNDVAQVAATNSTETSYSGSTENNNSSTDSGNNESSYDYSFIQIDAGDGMPRGNASDGYVLHLSSGGSATYTFRPARNAIYQLNLTYSNDDTGVGDNIAVSLNGNPAAQFHTISTGSGGNGWNNFTNTPSISITTSDLEEQTLTLTLTSTDGWGVEIDTLNLYQVQ